MKGPSLILQFRTGVCLLVIALFDVLVDILRIMPYTGIVEVMVTVVADMIPVAEVSVVVAVPVGVVSVVVVPVPGIPGAPAGRPVTPVPG
jgi:hypothetical protein